MSKSTLNTEPRRDAPQRQAALPKHSFPPRLVTAAEGAALLGLEPSQFGHWVSTGRLPQPLPEINKWDAKALHAAIDRISGIDHPTNALDAWRDGHRAV